MRTDCSPTWPATAQTTSYNLQRLLYSFTPVLPSRTIPQSPGHGINQMWQPVGNETAEFFALKDLWDSYDEPSAFGARTKVVMNNGEVVNQYYVPYLSALQIYTNKTVSSSRDRSEGNEGMGFESDLWSDESRSDKLSRSLSDNSCKGCCDSVSEEDSSLDQPVSWSTPEIFGLIYLEYFEACSPNWRIPLADKIGILAKDYPALMTLRSSDLSPASWMAVAWYPIYHIPKSSNKDLCACFLTYHTLSSSFLDTEDDNDGDRPCLLAGKDKISLHPFGLSTYKMQGDLWVKQDTDEHMKFTELMSAAHSWVKQLGVHHHDLNFFDHHHWTI